MQSAYQRRYQMITFFQDFYDQIYNFFAVTQFSGTVLVLKLVSYAVSFFFIFLIAALLKRSNATWWVSEGLRARRIAYGGPPVDKKWQKILSRLASADEANWKLAVIEADNIFDDILKRMGLPGSDFEECLRQFEPHELKSVNLVWEAHRLRNFIIQEPATPISKEQAEEAVKNYEAALRELEYL